MTNAFVAGVTRDEEGWRAVKDLAKARGGRLVAVTLDCSLEANLKRLATEDRMANRKLVSEEILTRWRSDPDYVLLRGEDADLFFSLDNTNLSADAAARAIREKIDDFP